MPFNGEKNIKEIVRIVEKPKPGTEPSAYAAHGAYALPPSIFEVAKKTKTGRDNELWLVDVINNSRKEGLILASLVDDVVYLDCGNPKEYLLSQLEYALAQNKYGKEFTHDIKKLLKKYK